MAEEKKKGLSGNTLKIIAIIAMFIDHSALIILDSYLNKFVPYDSGEKELSLYFAQNPDMDTLNKVSMIMHLIGRLAFPIFAFLIVEGYKHTRSVKKYAKNLVLFALISEIPYDIAFEGKIFAPERQNVMFTLLFGVLCITFLRYLQKKLKVHDKNIPIYCLSSVLLGLFLMHVVLSDYWISVFLKEKYDITIIFVAGAAAVSIVAIAAGFIIGPQKRKDFAAAVIPLTIFGIAGDIVAISYGACGVAAIFILYLLKKNRNLAFVISMLVLGPMGANEIFAILTIIPVLEYNGERGNRINKYFFYSFYPAHLIILYIVALLAGIATFSVL